MSGVSKENMTPLESFDQMISYFQEGIKTISQRRIGTEHEKFLFNKTSGKLLHFEGPCGIDAILGKLEERYDWEPAFDAGTRVGLTGSDGAISLEPGGQFELSGAIRKTIFETQAELTRHFEQLNAVTENVAPVCWGLNPWDKLDEVPWMPKSRYAIMKSYLPTRGKLAHWMMKMTCTIQANLDYTSEADAVDAVQLAMKVTPFVNALFANSPWKEGKPSGFESYRGQIWTQTDNDRSGIPEFMFGNDWGFVDYMNWAIDVPMFFIQREEALIDMSGHSFRSFFENGFEGYKPTMGDFELHLSTVFPEVRLKKYFEVRSADGGPFENILALPAFWKGIIYDDAARKKAKALLADLNYAEHQEVIKAAREEGLSGVTSKANIAEICSQLVSFASEGLDNLKEVGGESESIFLEPLNARLKVKAGRFSNELAECDRLTMIDRHDALASFRM